jgi:hypothetical protein
MLSGWFFDIFVEYLFRVLGRAFKRRRSRGWPMAKATVVSSACPIAGYGCNVAEVVYTYRVNGELHSGTNEKPFISHDSGENYINHYPPGTEFNIRVKPDDPEVSIVP